MNKDVSSLAYIKNDHSIYINEQIFERIAQNDKTAFTQLYQATSKAIYAYILTYVKNPEDASDLMQDTYLKIRAAAHLYQPQGKPMAWIFTIAKNLSLMKLRKEKNHPQDELDDNTANSSNPQNQAEARLVLESAMKILSQTDSQIVMLHAVSGMKHREIAKMLNLSLTATLNRYHRALKKLKTEIGGDYYE